MNVIVTFGGTSLASFAKGIDRLGIGGLAVMASALNQAGESIREATVGAETAQTGLKRNVLERALHAHQASASSLGYTITSKGGDISLKYFGAKEGGGGVTAHPFNKQTFFKGAFITSGRPGNRHAVAKLNGQVYVNEAGGAWHGRITKKKSGVYIPKEMVKGQTAAAFETGAGQALEYVVSRLGGLLP